jgi:hypothetical protein
VAVMRARPNGSRNTRVPMMAPKITLVLRSAAIGVAQHQLDGWRKIAATDGAALSPRRIRRECASNCRSVRK